MCRVTNRTLLWLTLLPFMRCLILPSSVQHNKVIRLAQPCAEHFMYPHLAIKWRSLRIAKQNKTKWNWCARVISHCSQNTMCGKIIASTSNLGSPSAAHTGALDWAWSSLAMVCSPFLSSYQPNAYSYHHYFMCLHCFITSLSSLVLHGFSLHCLSTARTHGRYAFIPNGRPRINRKFQPEILQNSNTCISRENKHCAVLACFACIRHRAGPPVTHHIVTSDRWLQ